MASVTWSVCPASRDDDDERGCESQVLKWSHFKGDRLQVTLWNINTTLTVRYCHDSCDSFRRLSQKCRLKCKHASDTCSMNERLLWPTIDHSVEDSKESSCEMRNARATRIINATKINHSNSWRPRRTSEKGQLPARNLWGGLKPAVSVSPFLRDLKINDRKININSERSRKYLF